MMKRILHVGIGLSGLALILAFTPLGATAQQTIRNITVDAQSLLVTEIVAMRAAIESMAANIANIESNLSADAVHGNAVIATGPQTALEAKNQDGAAFPNTVTEGQAIRAAGSLSGVLYVMPVNEDGSAVASVGLDGAALTALQAMDDDQAGASPSAVATGASTNATNVKASGGRVLGVYLVNTTATLYYLRFYNLASAPTCSSATGYLFTLPIPASTTGAGFSMPFPQGGLAFGTGIGYCVTGGAGSTDNTNAAAGIYGVISYK